MYTEVRVTIDSDGLVTMDCQDGLDNLPSFSVLIDDVYIEFLPEKYLLQKGNGTCYSGILRAGGEYYQFGNVFFRSYYSSFNDDTGKIAIAPNIKGNIRQLV